MQETPGIEPMTHDSCTQGHVHGVIVQLQLQATGLQEATGIDFSYASDGSRGCLHLL